MKTAGRVCRLYKYVCVYVCYINIFVCLSVCIYYIEQIFIRYIVDFLKIYRIYFLFFLRTEVAVFTASLRDFVCVVSPPSVQSASASATAATVCDCCVSVLAIGPFLFIYAYLKVMSSQSRQKLRLCSSSFKTVCLAALPGYGRQLWRQTVYEELASRSQQLAWPGAG